MRDQPNPEPVPEVANSSDLFSRYQTNRNAGDSIDMELNRYINEPVSYISTTNLIAWWAARKATYKNLYKTFLKVASVPATSSASERAFSAANNVITHSRSNLDVENANHILRLSSAIKVDKININELFD